MTVSSVSSSIQARHFRLIQLIEQLLEEGWTQSSLAESIGVDFSTVYRWLKGKTVPDPDSKNFRQLAKLSNGNVRTLQLYLDGEISLTIYRKGLETNNITVQVKDSNQKSASDDIKKEIIAKIKSLEPSDIAEVISSSVAFLANQV